MTDSTKLIERLRDREKFVMQGPAYLIRTAMEAAALIEQQAARIAEMERKERSTARLLCRHGDGLCVDVAALESAEKAEPVAWRVEHRPGRYMFVKHEENLKHHVGANIVPLFLRWTSVDRDIHSLLDRLGQMVTWEPRQLPEWDAKDRLERINELLYEALSGPSNPAISDAELAEIDRKAAEITDEWSERQAKEPTKQQADAMFIRNVAKLLATAPAATDNGGGRDAWISVADRMPPEETHVLAAVQFDHANDWRIKIGGIHKGNWMIFGGSWTPTHWRPLPAAPAALSQKAGE